MGFTADLRLSTLAEKLVRSVLNHPSFASQLFDCDSFTAKTRPA